MPLSAHAHQLLEAFEQPGCPVCRLTLDSVHHYLFSLTYEYVNDVPTHQAIRAARGFCNEHGWHVIDAFNNTGLGVAVLYSGLIRNLLKDMGQVDPDGGRRQVRRAAGALEASGECPACTHQARVEEELLRNLLEHLDQEAFAAAFGQSAGVCLPHLRQALDGRGQVAAKARLLSAQQAIWARLQAHLDEFIRKNDYRFADEKMGEEGDSPRRAIASISGTRGIR
jgi:hypothetical protein